MNCLTVCGKILVHFTFGQKKNIYRSILINIFFHFFWGGGVIVDYRIELFQLRNTEI